MNPKPVARRQQASADLHQAALHYLREGGPELSLGFVEAIETAIAEMSESPGAGSQRYAECLQRPGLRFWQTLRFPYLIFYFERADHIDVLRILHAHRDIPNTLQIDATAPD